MIFSLSAVRTIRFLDGAMEDIWRPEIEEVSRPKGGKSDI